ncbi:MAG: zinc-ribbon domain-containing protein [Ruminiclostridium sp.]|nr:zinc-ribbon domain-containing protein [Ruminiclostridium sp.]
MKCSHCGAENEEGAVFCEECGQKITAPAPVQPKNICPNCGAENEDGALFCEECGHNMTTNKPQKNISPAVIKGTMPTMKSVPVSAAEPTDTRINSTATTDQENNTINEYKKALVDIANSSYEADPRESMHKVLGFLLGIATLMVAVVLLIWGGEYIYDYFGEKEETMSKYTSVACMFFSVLGFIEMIIGARRKDLYKDHYMYFLDMKSGLNYFVIGNIFFLILNINFFRVDFVKILIIFSGIIIVASISVKMSIGSLLKKYENSAEFKYRLELNKKVVEQMQANAPFKNKTFLEYLDPHSDASGGYLTIIGFFDCIASLTLASNINSVFFLFLILDITAFIVGYKQQNTVCFNEKGELITKTKNINVLIFSWISMLIGAVLWLIPTEGKNVVFSIIVFLAAAALSVTEIVTCIMYKKKK